MSVAEKNGKAASEVMSPRKKQKVGHFDYGSPAVHPAETLRKKADVWQLDVIDVKFARKMDEEDPLSSLRSRFHIPKSIGLPEVDSSLVTADEESVYLCGNSLGLMCKDSRTCLQRELDKWSQMGVEGHHYGHMPWEHCDETIQSLMANVVGAKPEEIALMNSLSVNLHLLLVSFYNPTSTRHKILIEGKAFPSDHYVVESQITLKGFDPKNSMLCLDPRLGEFTLRHEDVMDLLEKEGESIAIVLLPSVQYYTGQLFDMNTITKVAQSKGCIVGYDLAHAVGNVPLYLHDWGVDFACWCTYKYLNAGAGGIGGAFIHEKHAESKRFRFTGWWSHKMETRFNMTNEMDLSPGIAGYRISNPSVLLCASLEASLKVYNEVTVERLRERSRLLTAYMELLIKHYYSKPSNEAAAKLKPYVDIITPEDPEQRGCQLSFTFSVPLHEVFRSLKRRGVVFDHRKPSVIRVTPVHLYNSFYDVHRFMTLLGEALEEAKINVINNNGDECQN